MIALSQFESAIRPNAVAAIICATVVIVSSIYGLFQSRKDYSALRDALQLHCFAILMTIGIGSLMYFWGAYSTFITISVTPREIHDAAFQQAALDRALVEQTGIWFAAIISFGGLSGALMLLIKKENKMCVATPSKPTD